MNSELLYLDGYYSQDGAAEREGSAIVRCRPGLKAVTPQFWSLGGQHPLRTDAASCQIYEYCH